MDARSRSQATQKRWRFPVSWSGTSSSSSSSVKIKALNWLYPKVRYGVDWNLASLPLCSIYIYSVGGDGDHPTQLTLLFSSSFSFILLEQYKPRRPFIHLRVLLHHIRPRTIPPYVLSVLFHPKPPKRRPIFASRTPKPYKAINGTDSFSTTKCTFGHQPTPKLNTNTGPRTKIKINDSTHPTSTPQCLPALCSSTSYFNKTQNERKGISPSNSTIFSVRQILYHLSVAYNKQFWSFNLVCLASHCRKRFVFSINTEKSFFLIEDSSKKKLPQRHCHFSCPGLAFYVAI